MRSGGVLVAVLVAAVAIAITFGRDIAFAAPCDAMSPRPPDPVAAPVTAAHADAAAGTPGPERIAVPRATAPPPTLHEFAVRLRAGDAIDGVFARADFERLFDSGTSAGTEIGAAHTFADLDGGGADEAVVVVGDGWWGKQVDCVLFAPHGDTWRFASRWHLDGAARGTPAVRIEQSGQRRWVVLNWTDGWGTGYHRAVAHWLEFSGGSLIEVLTVATSGEELYGGSGLSLDWGVGDLTMRGADDGAGTIATATRKITFWAGELGSELGEVSVDEPMGWRQGAPGQPFVANEATQEGADTKLCWRTGARAWLAKHGVGARALVAGSTEQRACLRRTCAVALEGGPFAPASELQALLPPE